MVLPREAQAIRARIQKDLNVFPYSFSLQQEIKRLKKNDSGLLGNQKNSLEAALAAGYETDWERGRTQNLLVLVLFKLKKPTEALQKLDEVLKVQPDNLVSLANKAHILSEGPRLFEARKILGQLQDLKTQRADYYVLELKARAELASSYMRFGPAFNHLAVKGFREILPEAQGLEERWTWQFALAVALRQTLSLQYAPWAANGCGVAQHKEEVLQLLMEIIKSSKVSKNLEANARVEVALLLRSVWNKADQDRLAAEANTGPLAECKNALRLAPDDPTVLWKTGKVFRYYRDVFRSRNLLIKSVEMQETSAAHHHLGLTYKAMATNKVYGKLKTRRSGKMAKKRKEAKERAQQRQEGGSPSSKVPGPAHQEEQRTDLDCLHTDGVKTDNDAPAVATKKVSKSHNLERKGYATVRSNQCNLSAISASPKPRRTDTEAEAGSRQYRDVAEMAGKVRKAVKAASSKVTPLNACDENVQRAIMHLEKAVEFSCEENTRALYDLGLLYAATKNQDKMEETFEKIVSKESAGLLEQITALEQLALCDREAIEGEENDERDCKMEERIDMLRRALTRTEEMYSTTEEMKGHFKHIFQSPAALLKAADASGRSDAKKATEKAAVFNLIGDPTRSLELLETVQGDDKDSQYFQELIKSQVKGGHYETALRCLSDLRTNDLFNDVVNELTYAYVQNIYLRAGELAMQKGPNAKSFLAELFLETVLQPDLEKATKSMCGTQNGQDKKDIGENTDNSSIDPSSADQRKAEINSSDGRPFDVLLLHDEEEEEDVMDVVNALKSLLMMRCGLNVEINSDSCLLGKYLSELIQDNIDSIPVTIVVPGHKPMPQFSDFLVQAAEKETTVVIRPEGVQVPKELRMRRAMMFPKELLNLALNPVPLSPRLSKLAVDVFRFIIVP